MNRKFLLFELGPMSIEELSRLGDELLELANQSPFLEEIIENSLAEFHKYFTTTDTPPGNDPRFPEPPQLRIPGAPQFSMQVNPPFQQGIFQPIPGGPIPPPPLGSAAAIPPANFPFWGSYPHP
jgi:hypothetical protein